MPINNIKITEENFVGVEYVLKFDYYGVHYRIRFESLEKLSYALNDILEESLLPNPDFDKFTMGIAQWITHTDGTCYLTWGGIWSLEPHDFAYDDL